MGAETRVYPYARRLAKLLGHPVGDDCAAFATGWPCEVTFSLKRICHDFERLMLTLGWSAWEPEKILSTLENRLPYLESRAETLCASVAPLEHEVNALEGDLENPNPTDEERSVACDRLTELGHRVRALSRDFERLRDTPLLTPVAATIPPEVWTALQQWAEALAWKSPPTPPRQRRAPRDQATEERDKYIYDEYCKGVPLKNIASALSQRSDWEQIASKQGIQAVVQRYTDRHSLPPLPPRRSRREDGTGSAPSQR
jgi:hypothetical protein